MNIKRLTTIISLVGCISLLSACSNKIVNEKQEITENNHTDTFIKLDVTPTINEDIDADNKNNVDVTEEINNNTNTGSGLQRDVIAESADINSDKQLTAEESEQFNSLDFSQFKTGASINVMKQLLKSENKETFEVFHTGEYYSNDIPTTVYYVTMDKESVHYIYEQNNTAYALPDENFNYTEVVKMVEEDSNE